MFFQAKKNCKKIALEGYKRKKFPKFYTNYMNSKFGYIEHCLVTIWVLTIYLLLFHLPNCIYFYFYVLNFVTIFIYLDNLENCCWWVWEACCLWCVKSTNICCFKSNKIRLEVRGKKKCHKFHSNYQIWACLEKSSDNFSP